MDRSRPVGSLGGGGWEAGSSGSQSEESEKKAKDKVLAEMYEMFLDSLEPDIISTVVQSFNFNRKKSMEALLELCGGKDVSPPQMTSESKPESKPLSLNMSRNDLRGKKNLSPTLPSSDNLIQFEDKQPTPSSPSWTFSQGDKNQSLPLSSILSSAQFGKDEGKQPGSSRGMLGNYPVRNENVCPPQPTNSTLPLYKHTKGQNPLEYDKMEKIRWFIENSKRILIIMRGLPGSGKTYLAQGIIQQYGGNPQQYVFSTDDYFIQRNGVYIFDPTRLSDAHQWNQTKVLRSAREGLSPIIVDNTNTQLWEMTVYATIAVNNGYAIEILEPETPWFCKLAELVKRNRHGVPRDKIKLMLERYESGITVEDLLKSSGASYSKPLPQAATRSFSFLKPSSPRKTRGLQQPGLLSNVAGKRNSDDNPIRPKNCSTTSSVSPANLRRTTSVDSQAVFHTGAFYFGPNSSSQNLDLLTSPVKKELESKDIPERSVALEGANSPFEILSPMGSAEGGGGSLAFSGGSSLRCVISRSKESEGCTINNDSRVTPISELEDRKSSFSLNLSRGLEEREGGQSMKDKNGLSKSPLSIEDGAMQEYFIPKDNSGDNPTRSQKDSDASKSSKLDVDPIGGTEDKLNSKPDEVLTRSFNFSKLNDIIKNEKSGNAFSIPTLNSLTTKSSDNSSAFSFSSLSDMAPNSSFMDTWVGTASWNGKEDSSGSGNNQENSLPKPPRTFSMKNIDNYRNTVKDINSAAQTTDVNPLLRNHATSWSVCENSTASWQPIDKLQEDIFKSESVQMHKFAQNSSQRSRFSQCDVATNTHHADFSLLNNLPSHGHVEGTIILNAHDRDINEGRIAPPRKVPIKLMLDKGTLIEDDFEGEVQNESKQEKIQELMRLFPNRSQASIKELLKQCSWDVNYVSNILLDEPYSAVENDNDADASNDDDSDEDSLTQKQQEESPSAVQNNDSDSVPDDSPSAVNLQEDAEHIKRHIEQSIDFSSGHYSPHTLAIKNFRRGIREGAIPKLIQSASNEVPGMCNEMPQVQTESNQESNLRTSESSSDDDKETLEFIISRDFIQQLVDKFGGSCKVNDMTTVVKFPVTLARQIYDTILSGSISEEEEDGDFAMKLQCEEDERMARQLYEEMLRSAEPKSGVRDPPKLREIMDMELAQAIYKSDVDSLTQSSQETMAKVLAKRLLEENYSQIDKRTLNDIFVSCNCSFEDTVKTLQEALSTDDGVYNAQGSAQEIQMRKRPENSSDNFQPRRERTPVIECKDVAESIGIENPWELSDPTAYYDKYRAKADEFLKERDEMYSKASDAFRRKQRSAAAYYSKLGELIGKKYHHANALAAAALAASHTNTHSSETLDLHHFKVVEAVTVFDLFMDHHIRSLPEYGFQQQGLDIITGRGTHSVNGKPRIKPAIINRIKKRNLRYQSVPNNPGILKVWVSVHSYLSHQVPD